MSIPSLIGVWLSFGPLPLVGPVFLVISIGIWFFTARQVFRIVRARLRQPMQRSEADRAVLGLACVGLIPFSIGAFHLYDSVQRLSNGWRWQIAPEAIAEIEVVHIPAMNEPPDGPPIYLRDPALLRAGFRRLADARFYIRHAEIYQDGYRLRLREVGAAEFSDRYLFVYRRSDDKPWCPAVVFERGLPTKDDEAAHLAGEFLSPAFVQWVNNEVAPRFAGPRP